jgi:hypothetical protein
VAHWLWAAGIIPVLAILIVTIILSLRRGDFGLDVIAALAMGFALAGGEALAGIIVALMFAGGAGASSNPRRHTSMNRR